MTLNSGQKHLSCLDISNQEKMNKWHTPTTPYEADKQVCMWDPLLGSLPWPLLAALSPGYQHSPHALCRLSLTHAHTMHYSLSHQPSGVPSSSRHSEAHTGPQDKPSARTAHGSRPLCR